MQNGSIGEARAKAFLIDRFWILERSVDIDGADFIIQRKVTKQNLLDRNPPRLGVVQVKFFDSNKTYHYIPKVYIVDNEEKSRDEFFVLCHTGSEDNPKTFFLTAKEILENFEVIIKNGVEKFRISGNSVLNTNRYLITSNKNTLDRIENQLKLADFTKNRNFLSWKLPSANSDTDAIITEFKEPLDNWWGEIPKEFKNLKESAHSAMINIEEIYDYFKKITEEIDPIKAFEYLNEISYECRDGLGNWSISLPNDLYDEDFETVCHQHIERVNHLKEKGLLDKFIGLKQILKKTISNYICENLPIDANTVLSIFIDFSKEDLTINSINFELTQATDYWNVPNILNKFGHIDTDKYHGIKDISDGKFEYYWLAGRIWMSEIDKTDIPNFYRTKNFSVYYECMEKMYEEMSE
ncbi:hypothetical protein [Tenacibaculum todarodis]|nr:hypothetical protein [Tenacibaculum todarodis]